MSLSIQCFGPSTSGQITIMFFEESKSTLYQWQISCYINFPVIPCFQNHLTEFEYCIPFVFQPSIILYPLIKIIRTFCSILRRIRQTEVLDLFGKTGTCMLPIDQTPKFCITEHPVIKVKLRGHHIQISAL